jgi:hypothetical protein
VENPGDFHDGLADAIDDHVRANNRKFARAGHKAWTPAFGKIVQAVARGDKLYRDTGRCAGTFASYIIADLRKIREGFP